MSDQGIVQLLVKSVYQTMFPEPLRTRVRSEFETGSWIEFCNRLTGIGLIMFVIGGITLILSQADMEIPISSNNPYQAILQIANPLFGIAVLVCLLLVFKMIGIATDDGIPARLSSDSRNARMILNVVRILAGFALLSVMFVWISQSTYIERTMIESVIYFTSMIGILCLILAPIFYGFGLILGGILNMVGEYRSVSENTK